MNNRQIKNMASRPISSLLLWDSSIRHYHSCGVIISYLPYLRTYRWILLIRTVLPHSSTPCHSLLCTMWQANFV